MYFLNLYKIQVWQLSQFVFFKTNTFPITINWNTLSKELSCHVLCWLSRKLDQKIWGSPQSLGFIRGFMGTKDNPSNNYFTHQRDQKIERPEHLVQTTGCPWFHYGDIIDLGKAWWSCECVVTCTAQPSKSSSSRLSSSTAASEDTEISVIIIIITIISAPHHHPPYHYHLNVFCR